MLDIIRRREMLSAHGGLAWDWVNNFITVKVMNVVFHRFSFILFNYTVCSTSYWIVNSSKLRFLGLT